ncbi:hypothetical protein HMI55_003396 [Coelomomyces lativittatus]|nr:hypothetical protein HMI55_003396 [Coelomomyces lativittatus]
MEYKHLRFTPFLAIALANVVPLPVLKDDIHSITIHTEMVHAIALLETTMISWAMVTNEHLTHLMDAFHAHFFYEKLMRFTPQSVSCVIEQLAEDYSDEVLDFFKSVFGEELDMSSIDFEDDGGFWVFDLN